MLSHCDTMITLSIVMGIYNQILTCHSYGTLQVTLLQHLQTPNLSTTSAAAIFHAIYQKQPNKYYQQLSDIISGEGSSFLSKGCMSRLE